MRFQLFRSKQITAEKYMVFTKHKQILSTPRKLGQFNMRFIFLPISPHKYI